jgi:hypothetical protein
VSDLQNKESAIVVLVPQAQDLVQAVRRQYDLTSPPVPAHITVLYPFLPPHEITGPVLADLRRLFAAHRSFDFALARLETFPQTLYLVPVPGKPFEGLTEAVFERYPERPPYGGAFDEIVPHLTLGHLPDETPIETVRTEVMETLGPGLPVCATAREVHLMDNSCGVWCVHSTFELGS